MWSNGKLVTPFFVWFLYVCDRDNSWKKSWWRRKRICSSKHGEVTLRWLFSDTLLLKKSLWCGLQEQYLIWWPICRMLGPEKVPFRLWSCSRLGPHLKMGCRGWMLENVCCWCICSLTCGCMQVAEGSACLAEHWGLIIVLRAVLVQWGCQGPAHCAVSARCRTLPQCSVLAAELLASWRLVTNSWKLEGCVNLV